MAQAVKLAPQAIVVPPRFSAYAQASEEVFRIFESFTPQVEGLSLDEAFLDVTASSSDRETTYDVVRRTAEQVFIPLTVGGGVRAVSDVDRLLRAGADKVSINTAATVS